MYCDIKIWGEMTTSYHLRLAFQPMIFFCKLGKDALQRFQKLFVTHRMGTTALTAERTQHIQGQQIGFGVQF